MREIKFRAWGTKTKTMYCEAVPVLGTPVGDGRIYVKTNSPLCDGAFIKHGVLMQYTGLKDKNGKEIYEGDIVFGAFGGEEKSRQGVIEYATDDVFPDTGAHEWAGATGFHIKMREKYYQGLFYTESIEVIGNIYQNPELLK